MPATGTEAFRAMAFGRDPFATFTAESGTAFVDPAANRPPTYVHVAITAGDLSAAFETFTYPSAGPAASAGNGLTGSDVRRDLYDRRQPAGLFLGPFSWNGRSGTLLLAPPFDRVASIHADHLIFRWSDGKAEYALSLHAWEPFLESVAALQAMVESLPPPSP
jgi:hypothetical protein